MVVSDELRLKKGSQLWWEEEKMWKEYLYVAKKSNV